MTGWIAVNVRIGHNTVLPDIILPAPVGIQTAGGDICLISRAVHIVNEHPRNFGKYLSAIFLSEISRQVTYRDDLILFSQENITALGWTQPAHLLKCRAVTFYDDLLQIFRPKGIVLLCLTLQSKNRHRPKHQTHRSKTRGKTHKNIGFIDNKTSTRLNS